MTAKENNWMSEWEIEWCHWFPLIPRSGEQIFRKSNTESIILSIFFRNISRAFSKCFDLFLEHRDKKNVFWKYIIRIEENFLPVSGIENVKKQQARWIFIVNRLIRIVCFSTRSLKMAEQESWFIFTNEYESFARYDINCLWNVNNKLAQYVH